MGEPKASEKGARAKLPLLKRILGFSQDSGGGAPDSLEREVVEAERGAGLAHPDNRFVRVRYLRRHVDALVAAVKRADYPGEIVIRDGEAFVNAEGVLLSLNPAMNSTDRYLKLVRGRDANEGRELLEFLRKRGIEPKRIVDVGANMGEVSLYFSRECPEARILAIEASAQSLPVLRRNIAVQSFPTGNVTVVAEAVSDKKGEVEISMGLGGQNSIAFAGTTLAKRVRATEKVKADTLDSIARRHGFDRIDFLKIDIEGAEPLLLGAIERMLPNIKVLCFEVWRRAAPDAYTALVEFLFAQGMTCYRRGEHDSVCSRDLVVSLLPKHEALDLLFVHPRPR